MSTNVCPHCHAALPDPPGELCPSCRRHLDPTYRRWVVAGIVLFLIAGLAIFMLVRSNNASSSKARQEVCQRIGEPDC